MGLEKHFDELSADKHKHKPDAEESGCVTKCRGNKSAWKLHCHGAYRTNGYFAITDDKAKRSYYEKTAKELKDRAAKIGVKAAWSEAGVGVTTAKVRDFRQEGAWHFENDRNFYDNGNWPYPHNSHHILPWASLKEVLSYAEAKLLIAAKYNINAGDNIIILPCNDKAALMLRMYKHPNNHKDYNKAVIEVINDVKKEIRGKSRKKEVHLTPPQTQKLGQYFRAWQTKTFHRTMKEGAEVADAELKKGKNARGTHVNEFAPTTMKTTQGVLDKHK
jgi:hypothetical protein